MSEGATGDPELKAMGEVLAALSLLDRAAQGRVLDWIATKLEVRRSNDAPTPTSTVSASQTATPQRTSREGTVSAVAIKLGGDSCRALLIAAAIHLTLYQGKDSFTRAEWLACAKDARSWKSDHSKHAATIIDRLLTAGTVFEKSKEVYCVDATFLSEQEAKIAK